MICGDKKPRRARAAAVQEEEKKNSNASMNNACLPWAID